MPIDSNSVQWDAPSIDPRKVKWDSSGPDYKGTAKSDSNLENLAASVGGVMYAPYLRIKQLAGAASPQDVEDYKRSMAGLWSTPMGKVGTVAGGLAVGAPLAIAPGANTLLGAGLGGAALGALQPVGEGDSTLANMALGGAGGVAGQAIGGAIAARLAKSSADKAAFLAAQKANNSVRDATLADAQAAGYALPPSQVNPSTLNRMAEGFAGKLTTAQNASQQNQAITNGIARQALGIPPELPLTVDTLKAVRDAASNAGYKPLVAVGDIPADQGYAQALDKIATMYDMGHNGMSTLRNDAVEATLKDASKTNINSANAVEFLKNLRDNGFSNIASSNAKDKMLGKVQLGIAGSIEDLIDRHLAGTGQQDLLAAYREARKQIAKSYSVETALDKTTGNVQASKLASLFQRGKPLSDGLDTIGRVGGAFPAATREVKTSLPQLSPLDYASSIMTASGAVASGHPGGAALAAVPFMRPLVRSAILSPTFQRTMVQPPSYEMGILGRNLPKLSSAESTRALERLMGTYGLLGIAPQQ